jgi:hypothetical protein
MPAKHASVLRKQAPSFGSPAMRPALLNKSAQEVVPHEEFGYQCTPVAGWVNFCRSTYLPYFVQLEIEIMSLTKGVCLT